jgi:hypothetical protein
MATMAETRTKAKRAGVSPADIRSAESVAELQRLIKRHTGGGTSNGRRAVKKSTVQKSKPATTRKATTSTGRKAAPVKGRNSSAATKRQSAASRKAAPAPKASAYEPKGGRYVLEDVDFGETDGWNARPGSAPDRIIKALKKYRGNREKVFDALVDEIGDFVKPKRRDGTKWAKGEREKMLAYRIARTAWDFALKTGQHEKASNRVEYGTGGTGRGVWKPARKAKVTKARTTKAKAAPKRNSKPAARKATTTRSTRNAPAPRKRAVRRK